MKARNQSGKERVVILGATGSIGRSTLDVIARHLDRFEVLALTAQTSVEALAQQCRQHHAQYAVIGDSRLAGALQAQLDAVDCKAQVLAGEDGLRAAASLPEADCIMAAIVGAAGLGPTLAAAQAGKKILLANKEAIVMAGPVFMAAVERSGSLLLPIDSEHNAVFQCLPPASMRSLSGKGVRRILLTASGGPFRTRDRAALAQVTPEEACAHPVWSMGRKISVDSATMMNKGLEIIEAHWLFGAEAGAIEVVIHPQSVIHSMVEYVDGSVIAQMGNPDMRTPIAQALGYPDRMEAGVPSLDLSKIGTLAFEAPDPQRFPALRLAYQALGAGGSAPTILNAANEVAVQAFLTHKLAFLGITEIIEETLGAVPSIPLRALDDVMEADERAREHARSLIDRRSVAIA